MITPICEQNFSIITITLDARPSSPNSLRIFHGKQEFRRTDFVSRLLAAEGKGGEGQCG